MSQTPDIPPTFDHFAEDLMRKAAENAVARIPELRGVLVIFDYRGGFNDSGAGKGIWIGDEPTRQTRSLEGTFGMMKQLLAVQQELAGHCGNHVEELRKKAEFYGKQVLEGLEAAAEREDNRPQDEGTPQAAFPRVPL